MLYSDGLLLNLREIAHKARKVLPGLVFADTGDLGSYELLVCFIGAGMTSVRFHGH